MPAVGEWVENRGETLRIYEQRKRRSSHILVSGMTRSTERRVRAPSCPAVSGEP